MPNFPFFYNPYFYNKFPKTNLHNPTGKSVSTNNESLNNGDVIEVMQEHKKNNSNSNDSYFFELFGLKLYFDDVLLVCLIFFLYEEGVKDQGLLLSLILLLLT